MTYNVFGGTLNLTQSILYMHVVDMQRFNVNLKTDNSQLSLTDHKCRLLLSYFSLLQSFIELQVTLCAVSVRTVDTLDQRYVLMPAAVKDAYLVHIVHEYLQKNSTSSVMIFTNTCKSVAVYCVTLRCYFQLAKLCNLLV